ncbi:ATP-dependent helicase [Desulfosarcina alkanivorans]|uniref:ATP-dependent helicase n=1 Tax=Desulfosarcina alkanivorans TaxID=571177 RepID=A0A5K7YE90_9BACT|nr:helicase C-terminal domain-containing protein [Desulfosarcina alkanivorans]BBO67388.1 ATP-dependent helicase [Desulfosarcina alkanivorans]
MKERHKIAVRTLVDVVLRAGDLDMRFAAPGRPLEGIRAHQKIQRQRPEGYRAEVPVSLDVETADLILEVGGRIDGVLDNEGGTIVEEIKSTTRDLESIEKATDPCHWGQVKVYAYLLAKEQGIPAVTTRLTYYHLDSGDTLELVERMTADRLESFFQQLVDRYLKWAVTLARWRQLRDAGILALDFPFPAYRTGQRPMAVAVYRAIRDGGQALIQASTGIGKTMAALFPAIKTMGEGHIDRIFFLTARNTGKASALKALSILQERGLRLKRVSLTAKDRICFCPDATCNPDVCAYARGHFDRLQAAMDDAFVLDNLDRDAIETVARSHWVCPFEFSLELSRWADCIVCDYNYAFDPRVYLKRFFDEEHGAYAFLVDEAHNLVDRSREMFSARLRKSEFLELRRAVKSHLPAVYRAAGKINTWMRHAGKGAREAGGFQSEARLPDGLEPLLRAFLRVSERWLARNQPASYRDIVMDRYFGTSGFLRVWDQYDDSYVTCRQVAGRDLQVKLFCLDPSGHLKRALKRSRATIFFSATLMPATYFQDLFGCEPTAVRLAVPSPFPRRHLEVLIATGISTYYAQREQSVDRIRALVRTFIRSRKGNYLCFFPSYEYMNMVAGQFEGTEDGVQVLVQDREMDDAGRARFLERFSAENDRTLVGFAVMGGIFGEGIDLVGDRLSGAVIVGVGLPAICPERDLIRRYFDGQGAGFDFAYRYPGINRVLQAAGRVIRTHTDRGAILLVDRRFFSPGYQQLLPVHWSAAVVRSERQLAARLHRFWSSAV